MKQKIAIFIIFISIFAFADSKQSFNLALFNESVDYLLKSWDLQIADKTVKAEKEKKEGIKILDQLFKKNQIIEAEFIKSEMDSDSFTLNIPEFKTIDNNKSDVGLIFKIYHNSWDDSYIKTSDDILEKYQDCEIFKAKIKMINYMNMKDEKPYFLSMETNGHHVYIEVNCKIIYISPIIEK